MAFFQAEENPDNLSIESFQYTYLDIQQIWLINESGLCLGHWYFHGESLDADLFAAFVSALFSFSRDMSSGSKTNKIRNMSFSELDIYYLSGLEDKYFTAMAVNQNTNPDKTLFILQFISNKFYQNFRSYILDPSPEVPKEFKLFHRAIKNFILINEHISLFIPTSKENFNLRLEGQVKSFKRVEEFSGILCQDNILRIFRSNPLRLENVFFTDKGKFIDWKINPDLGYIAILTSGESVYIVLQPLAPDNMFIKPSKYLIPIEKPLGMVSDFSNKEFLVIFSETEYYMLNLQEVKEKSSESIPLPREISQVVEDHTNNLILYLTYSGEVFGKETFNNMEEFSPVPINKPVKKIFTGPKGLVYFFHEDNSLAFSNLTSSPVDLKIHSSDISSVLVTSNDDAVIFFLGNKIIVIDELGKILVTYPLITDAISGIIEYNKRELRQVLHLVSKQGKIIFFPGIIERKKIHEQNLKLTRKFDNIGKKLTSIEKSIKMIRNALNNSQLTSEKIQNFRNQVSVYYQQLKKAIPTNLDKEDSLPFQFQEKLTIHESLVEKISRNLNDLDTDLKTNFIQTKHQELQSISPSDRILDYIAKMKPRESITVDELAKRCELTITQVAELLESLQNKKQLLGTLKEISKTKLVRNNLLFTKQDPELEKFSRKLSF